MTIWVIFAAVKLFGFLWTLLLRVCVCVWSYVFLAVLHEMGSTSASKAVPALFSSVSTAMLWKTQLPAVMGWKENM